MPKGTMYYTGNLEVWFKGRRLEKMELAQTNERYLRSLYATGHVLRDEKGKEYGADEVIHPANRV